MKTSGITAIGYGAGYNNVTGTNNTWLGASAGYGGTGNNSNNVGIGQNALLSVTTGSQNVVIGALAGDAIQGNGSNTLIGYNAGSSVTSGPKYYDWVSGWYRYNSYNHWYS